MKTLSSRKWVIGVILIIAAGMIAFMTLNYIVDPVDYYAVSHHKETYNPNNYTRKIKTEYIMKEFPDVECIILGGSKAGVLDPERITGYSGLSCYNFSFTHGNMSDYEIYLRYLLDHTDNLKEIILHLSSIEVRYYSWNRDFREEAETRVPAMVTGVLWDNLTENLSYLCTNIQTTFKAIKSPDSGISRDTLSTGQKNWRSAIESFSKDPAEYLEKNFYKNARSSLQNLFARKASGEALYYRENLRALERVKELCSDHNVKLTVVVGASSIYERYDYECEEYLEYFRQIVMICGSVWDFSSYCSLNLNAANFYEKRHYTSELGDLEIDIMYGEKDSADYDSFGQLLTPDNIDDYLTQRRSDWQSLKEEFETDGALTLPGLDDPSYIAGEDGLSA